MECAPTRAQAWLDQHEDDLHALSTDDAVILIASAGLHARVVRSGDAWMAQEQRSEQITLRLTETGAVASIDAG